MKRSSHVSRLTAALALCSATLVSGQLQADEQAPKPDEKKSQTPQLTGHPFVEPKNKLPKPNTVEGQRIMAMLTTSAANGESGPTAKKGMPVSDAPKQRGESLTPAVEPSYYYRGLGEIFQYTNDGAPDTKRACGQAAISTILTYYNIKPRDTGYTVINDVYRRYGPDVAWGILGTSWQQMERALRGYGVPFNWYSGEDGLKNALNLYKPCIVMLDVGAIPEEGWGWGGHWVVAYGYDKYYIYLTNWNGNEQNYNDGGRCTWTAFRTAWTAQLAKANGTANMFICPNG